MWAIICAIGAGLCWGVGELMTKAVLHTKEIGPITLVALRTALALPILIAAQLIAVRLSPAEPADWHARLSGATWAKATLGTGLLAGAAALVLFYVALSLGEISRVKPISFGVAPLTAALLAVVFLGEPMTARKAAGVACVIVGIVALTWK